jgi:hypothetical protein
MAYQLSPGVRWSEIDLSTIVPSVSTTEGAFVGDFAWGPINEVFAVGNELELVRYFHKPDANNYTSWFTAANFLSYAESLKLVRAANTNSARNATSGNTGILIMNRDDYDENYLAVPGSNTASNTYASYGIFVAKYAGQLGNNLEVSLYAGASNTSAFNSWTYGSQFNGTPGTSQFVSNSLGANFNFLPLAYGYT